MSKPTVESEYVQVRSSGIHKQGLFAAKRIPKDAKVIEYVGDKVTKTESDRRAPTCNSTRRARPVTERFIFSR